MKPSEIKVGKTYINRGKGRTERTVVEISKDILPAWMSPNPPPDEPGVVYRQGNGILGELYLRSFAAWAGKEKP